MNKKNSITDRIRTKEDVKRLFVKMIEDKDAVVECVRQGRSISELNERGIKVAKLADVLG